MPRHRLDAFRVEGNMQIRNSIKIVARVGLLVAPYRQVGAQANGLLS